MKIEIEELAQFPSAGQAAKVLELSPQRIRQLIHSRKLRTIKTQLGNLILPADLEKLWRERGGR